VRRGFDDVLEEPARDDCVTVRRGVRATRVGEPLTANRIAEMKIARRDPARSYALKIGPRNKSSSKMPGMTATAKMPTTRSLSPAIEMLDRAMGTPSASRSISQSAEMLIPRYAHASPVKRHRIVIPRPTPESRTAAPPRFAMKIATGKRKNSG
jgi:hypothetical protein